MAREEKNALELKTFAYDLQIIVSEMSVWCVQNIYNVCNTITMARQTGDCFIRLILLL